MQWAINAYLLSLAALFAFGGRLADTVGHRKMVTLGVIVFAGASAMCGLTPKGSLAEAWIVTFRVVQGAGGAIMFPAALAIVVQTFELRERGRALAIFFGIAGGLTAIGPILGGYLTQWTWRAIFWVNIPVAIIALILIAISQAEDGAPPGAHGLPGLALIASGVALSVFGFQQSAIWGWGNPGDLGCASPSAPCCSSSSTSSRCGTDSPLIQVSIFRIRPFLVENIVLGDRDAGVHPGVLLRERVRPDRARQDAIGGRPLHPLLLHRLRRSPPRSAGACSTARGAKRPVVLGCALERGRLLAVGGQGHGPGLRRAAVDIILAGAGMGMMLGPANTDAVNRASRLSYGEATGITQTVRNYSASLGLAILGTILVSQTRSRITDSLIARGLTTAHAHAIAGHSSRSRRAAAAAPRRFHTSCGSTSPTPRARSCT